jgi:ferredoxin-NADP reductase
VTINTDISVRVAAVTSVAERVKRFRLERLDGQPLPHFAGGAHVVVSMQDGSRLRRNPYSLMSPPHDPSAYEISVLRVEASRGGSAFMHEQVKPGDKLVISQPVNLFPIDQRGRKHILLAGGIGITPFMAMMEQLDREGHEFELHYAVRTRSHGAYWQHLQDRYGARRVKIYCDAESLLIPTARLLEHQPLGTHLYVCGPSGMIDGALGLAHDAGWPEQNLHSERFLAPPHGKPFRVVLSRSRKIIAVEEHQSILEALEASGVDAPFLCRGGACGQCETAIVGAEGSIEHNDHYLSDEEKASGRKIMICVSRLQGRELVLDL